VALKPGPDGKLYVKEGDIWRKVWLFSFGFGF
jgi:hypothetical protein